MILEDYYWYFKSAIPENVCDQIIAHAKDKPVHDALVGNEGQKAELVHSAQKIQSNISWLNDPWIKFQVDPYVQAANEASGWNFKYDATELIQFTKYGPKQYYDWHCDSWPAPYNKPNEPLLNKKIRKLSVSVLLSDPKDFKGGEFEFDFRNHDPKDKENKQVAKELNKKGSMIVFPSFIWHRVKPVTKGVRYSLVLWYLGHPWK